jgi:spore maturation protein CgeB
LPATVLLVAKPWRGGLGHYLRAALEAALPGQVEWVPTYPEGTMEWCRYRLDRRRWRRALVERVRRFDGRAALFLNDLPELAELAPDERRVLWITDAPDLRDPARFDPYARIFVSDPGYAEAVGQTVGEGRFGGAVPFAHLPSVHRPFDRGRAARRDVCLIANADPARTAHLEALLRAPVRATVVGNHFGRHPLYWRHPGGFRPPVGNAAMGRVYARHRLALNVHARVVRGGTNMRTFECAGYGIPLLADHRPGIESLFEPGREIALYREPEELPEALARLLADPRTAREMAERARVRALAEHRYEQRIGRLLEGLLPREVQLTVADT